MKHSNSLLLAALLGIFLVVAQSFGQEVSGQGRGQNIGSGNGQASSRNAKQHEVAKRSVIEGYGAVVQLPTASHQPREGSKVLVDITRGAEPDQRNAALEKVARYLNIYAAGGKEPAAARFIVVIHGDATRLVLHPTAYAEEFGTRGNPNTELLKLLHKAGVKFFVCGQTLRALRRSHEDTFEFVEIAVSALTACVNL